MAEKRTVKFGDICREVKLTTKDPIADGYERYIGLEHLDSGSLKIKRWGMIAEDNPSFTRVFKKGHILFGKRRPYLKKAAIAEFDGICSGDIIVLEPADELRNARILPHLIQSHSFWQHAIKTSSGSLSPRTKFKALSEFEVPRALDDIRAQNIFEKLHQVNTSSITAEDSGKSLLEVVLTNILTKGLNSEHTVNTKWFPMPADWKLYTIEDVAVKVTDGDHHTPQRSGDGELLLSARNILNGEISLDEVDYIPESEYNRMIKRCHPEEDDLLISCSGTIGRICLVPSELRFGLVRSVALVKFNKKLIFPKYLEWVFRSKLVQRQIAVEQLAAAQPNLFQGSIKKLCFPCPDYETQEKIADLLSQIEASSKDIRFHSCYLNSIKEAVIQNI